MKFALDIYAVMQHIPDIMGLELTMRNGAWEGRYYINGEKHAYKRDKLKIKLWQPQGRNAVIYVHEQGGESMSLQNWLMTYGGAVDYKGAMAIMQGNSKATNMIWRETSIIASHAKAKYVAEAVHISYAQYDLNQCPLFCFMCRHFSEDKVRQVWRRYGVTTNSKGDTVFWYYDAEGRICHDKIMRYGGNGHRIKSFGGSRVFRTTDGYTERCMFGSNLIKEAEDKGREICVVESEKTCLLAALMYPEKIWVASGGMTQLRDVDERVRLYPDIDAIEKWSGIKGAVIEEWWNYSDARALGIGDHDDLGDLIIKKMRHNGAKSSHNCDTDCAI